MKYDKTTCLYYEDVKEHGELVFPDNDKALEKAKEFMAKGYTVHIYPFDTREAMIKDGVVKG